MNDAVAAASADYPVDQTGGSYDFVGDYFPGIAPAPGYKISGGEGSFGTKWFWISGTGTFQGLYPGLIVHEMGHAYGSRHAGLWQTSDGDPVSATGKIAEYGDTYDPMGAATGYTQPYGDFNPWVKWHFGWIDDAQVAIVTAPGTYRFRIFRFDSAASTGLLSIKIPRGDGSNYWIGIRRNWVTKPLEMTGAYIIWGYDVLFHHSALIDCNTPGSNISDSALQVGQTLNDAPHGITITPLAIGGSDPNQYMDVEVIKQPTSPPTPTPSDTPSPTPTPTPTPNPSNTPTPTPSPTIQVTVQTNPAGLPFSVDGVTYTATQTLSWPKGSSHTIATTSPQSGGTGLQYIWKSWSDSGSMSHTVAPTTTTAYTATFTTQYYLTMSAGTGGTVSPGSGWKNSGTAVSLSATPTNNTSVNYSFTGWNGTGTGSYSGTNNPASITMSGPIVETAAFTQNAVNVTVQTNVTGSTFSVDGISCNSARTFSWQPGSSHTIATTSSQSGGTGVQYVWSKWSDGGGISHTVAPTKNTTYTATFTTQYYLTMSAGVGGTVTPASGWKVSGSSVKITATAKTGYSSTGWSGAGTGSFSGTTNPVNITMSGTITETATFIRNSSPTPTPTVTPTPTPTPTATPSDTPLPTPTPTPTPSDTPTPTPSETPTPTPTATPTATPSDTPTPTPTDTPTPTLTATPSPSETPGDTPFPTP